VSREEIRRQQKAARIRLHNGVGGSRRLPS
jgi:hypothetical protein